MQSHAQLSWFRFSLRLVQIGRQVFGTLKSRQNSGLLLIAVLVIVVSACSNSLGPNDLPTPSTPQTPGGGVKTPQDSVQMEHSGR